MRLYVSNQLKILIANGFFIFVPPRSLTSRSRKFDKLTCPIWIKDVIEVQQRFKIISRNIYCTCLDSNDFGEAPVHRLGNLILRQVGCAARSPELSPEPVSLNK